MTRRLVSFLVNLSLVLGSLIATLVLVEVGLRVFGFTYLSFHRPDSQLGLRLKANVDGRFSGEGQARVRTNAAGFRDRDRVQAKPPGTVRIAVLGDSYVEALQVDFDNGFTDQLERQLTACRAFGGQSVEVLNFGVSSYGTAQQLLTYRHHAARYSPDLVISAVFTGNDIRNNSRDLESDKLRPFFVLQDGDLVEDRSFAQSPEFGRRTNALHALLDRLRMLLRVVQAAYFVKDRVALPATMAPGARQADASAFEEAGTDNGVYSEPATRAWRDAWLVTEKLYAKLNDEVRAKGAKLVVVSLSSGAQVHPDANVRARFESAVPGRDLFYPDKRIEAIARRMNVPWIILAPLLQRRADRDHTYFHGFPNTRMGTGHWNEAGHRIAAELVAARLCHGGDTATS